MSIDDRVVKLATDAWCAANRFINGTNKRAHYKRTFDSLRHESVPACEPRVNVDPTQHGG